MTKREEEITEMFMDCFYEYLQVKPEIIKEFAEAYTTFIKGCAERDLLKFRLDSEIDDFNRR